MFKYYLNIALKNAVRAPFLSALIITSLGLGIASFTVIFTVIHLMSADPIPHKSDKLFRVQLDNWRLNEPAIQPNEPPEQVTWMDSLNIVNAQKANKQAAMAFSWALMGATNKGIDPFQVLIRTTHTDIFSMFEIPFLYGSAWSERADKENEYVIVISKEVNEKLFDGENSVGQTVIINDKSLTIVGVINTWQLRTKFYDLSYGPYYDIEDVFMPFTLRGELELPRGGNTDCPLPMDGNDYQAFLKSECVNYHLWVELQNDTEKQAYLNYLDQYVDEQRELGRFPRPTQNRLSNVMEWLNYKQVVNSDLRIILWLSVMFLLICIVNASSLITTKYITMRGEAGLRRALGASKLQIILQYLVETASLGLCGGILGMLFALIGLQGIKVMYRDYAQLVQPDALVISSAITLAIVSGILAGLIPILNSSRIALVIQIKQG